MGSSDHSHFQAKLSYRSSSAVRFILLPWLLLTSDWAVVGSCVGFVVKRTFLAYLHLQCHSSSDLTSSYTESSSLNRVVGSDCEIHYNMNMASRDPFSAALFAPVKCPFHIPNKAIKDKIVGASDVVHGETDPFWTSSSAVRLWRLT